MAIWCVFILRGAELFGIFIYSYFYSHLFEFKSQQIYEQQRRRKRNVHSQRNKNTIIMRSRGLQSLHSVDIYIVQTLYGQLPNKHFRLTQKLDQFSVFFFEFVLCFKCDCLTFLKYTSMFKRCNRMAF